MAKQRIVNTRFWDDSYISGLSPTEKLLFLYLLTDPVTNIAGVYELPLRRAAFDTGIPQETIEQVFHKFSTDGKILRQENWIGIKNFLRYQTLNPKVKQGVLIELRKAPKDLVDTRFPSVSGCRSTLGESASLFRNRAFFVEFRATEPQTTKPL
jgi:hypothetical protein